MRICCRGREKTRQRCCSDSKRLPLQALIIPDKFQHILRVLNTNIDGKQKIMLGLTAIKVRGISRYKPEICDCVM